MIGSMVFVFDSSLELLSAFDAEGSEDVSGESLAILARFLSCSESDESNLRFIVSLNF